MDPTELAVLLRSPYLCLEGKRMLSCEIVPNPSHVSSGAGLVRGSGSRCASLPWASPMGGLSLAVGVLDEPW